ncbi:MAG: nitrilase-related carbon-nitrogen hydrolase [Cyclobacteriaceae bacterium]|nr:nitrilase-related carbon-nitrogen hydrolase [Cyclobacteriaceae bacterium]
MNTTRRNFLKTAAVAGTTGVALPGIASRQATLKGDPSNSQIWIGTITQDGMDNDSPKDMVKKMLALMEEMALFKPDIICLPETFPYLNMSFTNESVIKAAERKPYPLLDPVKKFAQKYQCYIICPIITYENGRCYNAALLLDRKGNIQDEYKKIHPAPGEMEYGVYPGAEKARIWETDFGKIGVQICFDMQWNDGWQSLVDGDAEIIFWPSAFSGNTLIKSRAWQSKAYTVSSTNKGIARICDMTGEVIAGTGNWNNHWVCAPVNLNKRVVHTWPYVLKFEDVLKKYGKRLTITNYHEEEWSVFESLDPEIKIRDVLKEFDILDYNQHISKYDAIQRKMLEG